MGKTGGPVKSGKKTRLVRARRWANSWATCWPTCWGSPWRSPALVLALVAGCATDHSPPDPLKGQIHPQSPTQYGSAPANQNAPTKTSSGVPGIPSTEGPYSNAALAAIDGSRPPLAIDANNVATSSAYTPSANGPTVSPLPRDLSAPPVPGVASGTTGTQAEDILQAQLRARGVFGQKQAPTPDGGVQFSCIAPNRGNPDSSRIYEATARDLVSAIQAVIVQIDRQ